MAKTDRPLLTSISESLTPGRVGQLIAGLGAVFALLGAFATVLLVIGVVLMIIGVIVSAPVASYPGPQMDEWWMLMGAGAMVVLLGFAVGLLLSTIGGVLVAGGAVATLISLGLGFPVDDLD
jgi:hypothetical protein